MLRCLTIATLLEGFRSSFSCEMCSDCEMHSEHCQEDLYPEQEEPVNSDGWLLYNQMAQSFQAMCMIYFAKIKNIKSKRTQPVKPSACCKKEKKTLAIKQIWQLKGPWGVVLEG